MIYKFIGGLIIIMAGLVIVMTLKSEFLLDKESVQQSVCIQLTPSQQLLKLIKDDFKNLSNEKQLPEAWDSIATADFKMNSQLAQTILGKSRPSFPKNKKGQFHLELHFLDLPDNENPGLIIQASLFEIKSKNKIFEIGRTYTMNDLNKIPEAKKVSGSQKKKTK